MLLLVRCNIFLFFNFSGQFKKLSRSFWFYFVAIAEVYNNDGNDEYIKKEFMNAVHLYTQGINVNCKDDELNAKLYSSRVGAHFQLLRHIKACFVA